MGKDGRRARTRVWVSFHMTVQHLGHEGTWEISHEPQESHQETSHKDGWDKDQQLVTTGISSSHALRSSCREGWLDRPTSFCQEKAYSRLLLLLYQSQAMG